MLSTPNRAVVVILAAISLGMGWGQPAMGALVHKVTITVEEPTVYPLPPDGKSYGQIKAYDAGGNEVGLDWVFANGDTLGCQLSPDGQITAGTEVGEVKIKATYTCGDPDTGGIPDEVWTPTEGQEGARCTIEKTVQISCGGGSCQNCQ